MATATFSLAIPYALAVWLKSDYLPSIPGNGRKKFLLIAKVF